MMLQQLKIGIIGAGNIGQAVIKGLTEGKSVQKNKIYISNRSPGKLQKVVETYGVIAAKNNEELVDACDVVILAIKPQDLAAAVEPIESLFRPEQIVISFAAGISFDRLRKYFSESRLVRVMLNTPAHIRRGVIGYCLDQEDKGVVSIVEDMFQPLGFVARFEEGEKFNALIVSCASGTGFVYELMTYWQEWIEERGIDPQTARKMTVETFLGTAQLAAQFPEVSFEDLQARVTSKKGVTLAGLESMRELEIERALRYSFEKASMRNEELGRQS